MNAIFILVVVTDIGWGGTNVAFQEFSSKERCEAAATMIAGRTPEDYGMMRYNGGTHGGGARCTEK